MTHPYHIQEPKLQSGTSSVLNNSKEDFKDIQVLLTFKFNIESWTLEYKSFGTLLTHLHQEQEPKPRSYFEEQGASERQALLTPKLKFQKLNASQSE